MGLFGFLRECGLWGPRPDGHGSVVYLRERGLRGRIASGLEGDWVGCGALIDRGWGLGWDVSAAVGFWIGGAIGAGGGASLVGLALIAAQVAELLDGAEEAAAEMSVVAG